MPTPRKPKFDPTDRTQDPNILAGPAAFAKILGHSTTNTISHWVAGTGGMMQPERFPEPEDWDELPTRRRPLWRLATMWRFADEAAPTVGHAGGRPALPHPYADDPRLTRAREDRHEHPGTTLAAAADRLHTNDPTTSHRTWLNIAQTARDLDT